MKLFKEFDSKKINKIELNLTTGGCKPTTLIGSEASPGHHQSDPTETVVNDNCSGGIN